MHKKIHFPPRRKEKIDDKRTVPCPREMKEALKELDKVTDVHAITREFWQEAIKQWQEKSAS